MKIDMAKLQAAVNKFKEEKLTSVGDPHECWIPYPEKQFAKDNGVKWNNVLSRYEFHSFDADNHICSRFLPKNFAKLTSQVPFNLKEMFKELGVVTTKVDNVWESYVMMHEDYIKLVEALQECELL
jgi:hypothetical protein